ncbi:MAG: hypothetical protein PVH29_04105 [Candidatus Zixiibacteriota bacterium]|jgi:spermidine synthase
MPAVVFGFCLGAGAIVAQLELLREYLSLGGGNEIAVGLTLAAWLSAGGVGSLLAPRLVKPSWGAAAASFVALGLAYAFGLGLVWGGRETLGASPGEIVGWLHAFGFAFAVVGPAAFFGGATFALVAAAAGKGRTVYVAEAAGSCVAGLLLTTLLYRWMTPALSAGALCFCAAAAAVAASRGKGQSKSGRGAAVALAALAFAGGVALILFRGPLTERWFFERSFPGEEVLAYRTSPYGAIVATERAGQYSLYENGLLVASYPDRLSAEETVHPAMLLRPEAKRVILFGGGLSGAPAEFDKYPAVEEITYVELDAALVEAAAGTYDPDILAGGRIRHVAGDGRLWARRRARDGVGGADVIIVAMPAPASAQVNRYYTLEFYRDARALLSPGGLLAVSAPGAANYYTPELSAFLSSTRATLAAAFPHVAALPGERFVFLASAEPIDASPSAYGRALGRTGIRNDYLTETDFRYRLTPDRRAEAERAVSADEPPNVDFKPRALYYGLLLWSSRTSDAGRALLTAARGLSLWYIIGFAVLVAAPWFIWRRRLAGRPAVGLAVVGQGFVEAALEVLIIFGYQVVYGAAYLEMALIFGAFMAGLAVGGLLPRTGARTRGRSRLVDILGYTIIIAFALPPVFYLLSRWPGAPAVLVHLVFGGVSFAAGLCGGAQFVVALRTWGERGAGILYGMDMLGSAAGAVLAAAALVPILGIGRAAMAVAAVAAAAMAAVAAAPREAENP